MEKKDYLKDTDPERKAAEEHCFDYDENARLKKEFDEPAPLPLPAEE